MSPAFSFPPPGQALQLDEGPLVCHESLRLLPQRRLACRADWRNETVFAKIFRNSRDGRREWQKECANIRLLAERGVEVPRLRYCGYSRDGLYCVFITEWLDGALSLSEAWDQAERGHLTQKVSRLLAAQHAKGVVQQDLHPENLLLYQGSLFTIDCTRIDVRKNALNRVPALANLALLFVQLHPMTESQEILALQSYMKERDWTLNPAAHGLFYRQIRHQLLTIRAKTRKKLFRTCTAYLAGNHGDLMWLADRQRFAEGLSRVMVDEAVVLLGRPSGSPPAETSSGLSCVSFSVPRGWRQLFRRVMVLPEHPWLRGLLLYYQRIPVEQPLLAVWRPEGVWCSPGLLCAKVRQGDALDHFFKACGISPARKRLVAEQLLGILLQLRWAMVTVVDIVTAIRVDQGGAYFCLPYNIELHENRHSAYEIMAKAWRVFVESFGQDAALLQMFESVGCGRLLLNESH